MPRVHASHPSALRWHLPRPPQMPSRLAGRSTPREDEWPPSAPVLLRCEAPLQLRPPPCDVAHEKWGCLANGHQSTMTSLRRPA
jgi:hypothetical protein